MTFKFTRFDLDTLGRPDNIATVEPSGDIGTRLDINALDQLGLFSVPSPIANQTAYNAFINLYRSLWIRVLDDRPEDRRRNGRFRQPVQRPGLLPRAASSRPTSTSVSG